NRGTAGGGAGTSGGGDKLFLAQTHVAPDCTVGAGKVFANNAGPPGHVNIRDQGSLGAHVGVPQFCRRRDPPLLGGYSKVVKDALPYARTDGVDAKCYGANTVGLRRKGFSNEIIRHIQQAFRLLLASSLNTTQALERIKAEMSGVSEIDYLIKFIETSERGVTK